jgi:hypothetical protein
VYGCSLISCHDLSARASHAPCLGVRRLVTAANRVVGFVGEPGAVTTPPGTVALSDRVSLTREDIRLAGRNGPGSSDHPITQRNSAARASLKRPPERGSSAVVALPNLDTAQQLVAIHRSRRLVISMRTALVRDVVEVGRAGEIRGPGRAVHAVRGSGVNAPDHRRP